MHRINYHSRQIRNWILTIALVVILTGLCQAQFRTVTVQNAPANPIPTTIQNTPSVTVSGTPNVNATITGTPNVNVANTPTVIVGNTNAAPLPIIGSGNIAAAPVIIRNNDEPARQPFQAGCNASASSAGFIGCTLTTVPAGKTLVVETFDGFFTFAQGGVPYQLELSTVAGGRLVNHENVYTFLNTQGGFSNYAFHQLTRVYADAGSPVAGQVYVSVVTDTYVQLNISGYLVNVP